MESIAKVLPENHLSKFFVPIINEMLQSAWFTSRMSAAQLFPCVFGHLGPNKDLLK